MRILFLDQYSVLGGAQLSLRDTMIAVLERGWYAELMAPGNGGLFEFCQQHSIPAHSFPLGRYSNGKKAPAEFLRYGFDIARAALKVRSVVARSRIDLVVVNGPRILPAASGCGVPLILHLHNLLDKGYSRAIVRSVLRASRGCSVCCSRFLARPLLELVDPESVTIVYNGVADTGFTLKNASPASARIGILGRIAPEKGHEDFIFASRQIAATHPGVTFRVHGDSLFSDPAYRERVHALAAGAPVEFRGWTDDVPGALRELDILAVPSKGVEATPRVIMEAMAAGTPVVTYRSGGIPELIRHGVTGLMTDSPDAASLARAIGSLLSNSELRLHLGRNGRREWEQRFQIGRFQREMCRLFEQAIGFGHDIERGPKERREPETASAVAGKHNLV